MRDCKVPFEDKTLYDKFALRILASKMQIFIYLFDSTGGDFNTSYLCDAYTRKGRGGWASLRQKDIL